MMRSFVLLTVFSLVGFSVVLLPAAAACGPSDVVCVDLTNPSPGEQCAGAYFLGAQHDRFGAYVIVCEGAASCPAFLNFERISRSTRLAHGDSIGVGRTILLFRER